MKKHLPCEWAIVHTFWTAAILAVAIFAIFPPQAAAQTGTDTNFVIGINWMNFHGDTTAVSKLYDSSFRCTVYHVGTAVGTPSENKLWTDTILPNYNRSYAVDHYGGAIETYSRAERMLYQGIRGDTDAFASDTLTKYYFINHPFGNPFPSTAPQGSRTHWELTDSTANTDVMMMSGNQFPQGWRDSNQTAYYVSNRLSFRLAAKLQVATLTGANSNDVVDVYAIQSHFNGSVWVRDTGKVYGIHWNWLAAANTDSVFFSPSFYFSQPFIPFGATPDSMIIEVHSKRYVTTRVAWACIEDSNAHNLMAGVDLDKNVYVNLTNSTDSLIYADSSLVDSVFGSHLLYYYLADEPAVSEYTTMGQVNFLLNYRGNCEVGGSQPYLARFVKQVEPKHLLWSGDWGLPYIQQIVCYLDSGVAGCNAIKDSLVHGKDTFSLTTYRKYKTADWGYFPYFDTASANITLHNKYAANAHYMPAYNNTLDSVDYSGTDAVHSFDTYEFRQGCFGVLLHTTIDNGGMQANMIYNTLKDNITTEYWGNIFAFAHLSPYGYYQNGGTPTPAERSVLSNIAITFGAKGLLYFTGESSCCADDGDPWGNIDGYTNTGITDTNGTYSDYRSWGGNTNVPVMYNHATVGMKQYANWLINYGKELRGKAWLGAYTNHIRQDSLSPGKVDYVKEHWGINPVVDTTYQQSTRYMLKKWPPSLMNTTDTTTNSSDWKTFRNIPHGDSLVKIVSMPDSMTLFVDGFFADTSYNNAHPAAPILYMTVTNLFTDMRDIMDRWVDSTNVDYVARAERFISTKLKMNPSISAYYKVTVLDSTLHDTILPFNGTLVWHYNPGEMHIFKIEVSNGVQAGAGDIAWNNGRRMEFSPASQRFYVSYARNDSVFFRRSLPNDSYDWESEVLVAPDTALFHTAWQSNWAASHPSLRLIHTKIDDGAGVHRRTGIGITYDISVPGSPGQFYVVLKELAMDSSHQMPSGGVYQGYYWTKSIIIKNFSQFGQSYTPTPVIAPFYDTATDYGAVVSWADYYKIGAAAVNMVTSSFGESAPLYFTGHTPTTNTDTNEVFPSIVELTDTTTSARVNSLGIAFQSWQHIFFAPISVTGTGTGGNTVDTPAVIQHISYLTGDCINEHPCIDICRMQYGSPTLYTAYHISWDADQHILVSKSKGTFVDTRYVWTAMQNLWGGNWQYYVFGVMSSTAKQDNLKHVPKYQYPSIRTYDGYPSNLWYLRSVEIGCYDDNSYIHYMRDSNSSAYGAQFTCTDFHPNGTEPNLDVQTHALASFNTAHAAYDASSDVYVHDLSGAENPVKDTVLSWIRVQGTPKDSNFCFNDNEIWSAWPIFIGQVNTPYTTLGSSPTLYPKASALPGVFPTGTIGVSDTVLLPSSIPAGNPYVGVVPGLGWTTDSVTRAHWLGATGKVKYYLDVLNASTNARLGTMDSMTISASSLAAHFDTLHVSFGSSYQGDTVFLALRYAWAGAIDTPATNVAWFVAVQDTTPTGDTTSTLAKNIGGDSVYLGRAGMVAVLPNPLNLTVAPNPVRDQTNVSFTIPDVDDAANTTEVVVFDMLAHTVATLARDQLTLGQHTVTFNAANLPSGSYVVAVHTQNHMQSKLMILEK